MLVASLLHAKLAEWPPEACLPNRDGGGKMSRKHAFDFEPIERKGKRRTVIATAIARELSAFIWAINRELMAHRQA